MFFRILMYNNTLEKIGPHLVYETGFHLQHLYNNHNIDSKVLQIKTFYESMFLKINKPITYICFKFI